MIVFADSDRSPKTFGSKNALAIFLRYNDITFRKTQNVYRK